MIGPEGTDNCHKFVDILGLRTIFPLFMKSPRKIKKVGTTEKEHEGRIPWGSQPDLGALWEMGEMRATVEKLWVDSYATFFFFTFVFFCAWKSNPETPDHWWPLLLWFSACLNPHGSVSFWPVNKSVCKGFVSFTIICSKLSLWWKTLLKRVMRWQHMSPPEWCFHVFLY